MIKAKCGQSEQGWCKGKIRNERIQGDNIKAAHPLNYQVVYNIHYPKFSIKYL